MAKKATAPKKGKNWIKKAIKKPGALRKTAAKHGAMKNDTISHEWLKKASKGEGVSKKTAQRARFAITLKKMNKGKK